MRQCVCVCLVGYLHLRINPFSGQQQQLVTYAQTLPPSSTSHVQHTHKEFKEAEDDCFTRSMTAGGEPAMQQAR